MLVLSHAAGAGGGGALSTAIKCTHKSPLKFTHHRKPPPLFSSSSSSSGSPTKPTNNNNIISKKTRRPLSHRALCKPNNDAALDNSTSSKQQQQPPTVTASETLFVGPESVPLEGVIQFEKSGSSSSSWLDKWGRIGVLGGGDVLALLLFSAIGRFSHGFSVFDFETLRTADPFVAGWFLGAYFLGGYGEDGRGMNGLSKAIFAAAKSWALGIPLGLIIRAVTSGHVPPYTFIMVTMGSTAVLLIGWRVLSFSILAKNDTKKNDVYRRGSPFELFELLTSLVRRW